jgi:hypothetical protein
MFHPHVIQTVLNNSWSDISGIVKNFLIDRRDDAKVFLEDKVIDVVQIDIEPYGPEHFEVMLHLVFNQTINRTPKYSIPIIIDKVALSHTIVPVISQILAIFDKEQMILNWNDGNSRYHYRSVDFENDWIDCAFDVVPYPANNFFIKGFSLKISKQCFDYRLIKEVRGVYYKDTSHA